MIRCLIWNIRGIMNKPSSRRIEKLIKLYNLSFFAIIEQKSRISLIFKDSFHARVVVAMIRLPFGSSGKMMFKCKCLQSRINFYKCFDLTLFFLLQL